MLSSTCIVVPTYWTRAGGDSIPGDAVYDHPTALDGASTLPALLDSLACLDASSYYLVLLVAVTGDDVAIPAENRVREMVRAHAGIRTLIFGASHAAWLHTWLRAHGQGNPERVVALRDYPRIRNLQLAVPLALHAGAIIALDDDEIVTDPDFVTKAVEPLGQELGDRRIDGLSGHYEQDNGSILLRVDETTTHSPNVFERKASIMNLATKNLEAKPGDVVETPFCFGGNMEFTPELAATVGFDPEITRGEDIDYLINARMEGRHFFLRKNLRILHCPPSGGSYRDTSLSKLQQDIVRFVYEREKLLVSQRSPDLCAVTASELEPYPGEFLREGIDGDAKRALQAASFPEDAQEFVNSATRAAQGKMERYLRFRRHWPELTKTLQSAPDVHDWLTQQIDGL